MRKASEYRQHAAECRAIAAHMESLEQRQQILEMADHWEKLAVDRVAWLQKHPQTPENEPGEGRTWADPAVQPA